MTKDRLNVFLNALQDAFMESDWDNISEFFQLPLVIYTAAGVTFFREEERLVQVIQQYREALGKSEVASTTLDVEQRDTPSNRRLRATVRITDFAADGHQVRHSLIRYFLVEHEDSYKVEMLEYIEASLSLTEVQRIIH